MALYYLSAVEFIKNRNFEVWVPAFYHPHMPEDMLNSKPQPVAKTNRWKMVTKNQRNPLPFQQHTDPNQMQRASYSIEIMLDMFRKKIEFQIALEDDIPEIFDGLDRYLMSIKPDVEVGVERTIEYAKLVLAWREEVYKHYYRYMQSNTNAMDRLYPNGSPTKNLVHLMSLVSGVRQETRNLDPLRARANPPYRIDAIVAPLPGQRSDGTFELEDSLGISTSTLLNDDGRDFNFDDFLKQG